MSNTDTVLNIIRSPQNGMRHKNAVVFDIKGKDLSWLHLTGGAQNSIMTWLQGYHKDDLSEVPKDKVKDHTGKKFVCLNEPEHRYWTGIVEWSSNFGTYEWWQHDDIMEWFPHFDRYTLRYSEQIDQVQNVTEWIKIDREFGFKMENLIKKYDFNLKWEFPHVRPRYKKVEWVEKIYEEIMPKFKDVVKNSNELSKKLEDYLAPDYDYYIKAV